MPESLLIEIGTEEFPLPSLDVFYASGKELVEKMLLKNRLESAGVRIEATPRRLVFFIANLSPKQREERTTILGPAYDKAYDPQGKPTQALEGFLRAQKVSRKEIRVQETPRGRYVALEKVHKGEATVKLLPRVIRELLVAFAFPKTMRWEATGFRFPRPIRWAVVLFGRKAVSFSLAGIKTGRTSFGHRFLAPRPFIVREANWKSYEKELSSRHVVISVEEREALIVKGLRQKFHQKDFDTDLVHEAASLVEAPFLVGGKFSGTYRDLPEEVLATCMKKYQKIFASRDERGHLQNRFIAVLNGRRSGLARIQEDYENVLESRLRDAHYFYDEDTKLPLENKVVRLKELVFLGRLGTMEDKVNRLRELAADLARLAARNDLAVNLERIAFLSKADLVTHMVGEFPELQGVMGREYAQSAKESEEIVRAIGEQYLPKNLGEDYRHLAKKMSLLGAFFGIMDRIDLLVGAFGSGLEPTGSEDPYALRRAGGALVKLVRAFSIHFPLFDLIGKNVELYKTYGAYPKGLNTDFAGLNQKVRDFLKDRVAFELQVKPGTRPFEILQGVVKSSFDDLADVFTRFEVLAELSSKHPKAFFKTSKIVERTANILKGVKEPVNSVDPNLFQVPLERELFGILEKREAELKAALEKRDYETITRLYGDVFFDSLHHFFDEVMVNVEDQTVRRNRLALMKRINVLYTEGVADLSVLTQVKE
jgi:glycyl-tRNA synthetase beta chain